MVVRNGTWNLGNLFRPGEQVDALTHAASQEKKSLSAASMAAQISAKVAAERGESDGDGDETHDLADQCPGRGRARSVAPGAPGRRRWS